MSGCVCIQGEYFAPTEARISPLDLGFLFGDGCFETLRTFAGKPFRLEAHIQRLVASAEALHFSALPSLATLREWTLETFRRSSLPDAVLRITVSRGMSMAPSGPTVVIAALPLPNFNPRDFEGIAATLLWERSPHELPFPWVKSTSYQKSVLARHEVTKRHAAEGLYLGQDGTLTEGATSNLFFILNDVMRTAPETVCLPGITRREVLDIATSVGLTVELRALHKKELPNVSEAFISSSLAGLRPILAIDETAIGSANPGPWFQTILAEYTKRTRTQGDT